MQSIHYIYIAIIKHKCMKTKFLFPNYYKLIGWLLMIPTTILGILIIFYDFEIKFLDTKVFAIYSAGLNIFGEGKVTSFGLEKDNITDEIVSILFIVGAVMVAFSKEKQEDEFIAKTRLESLVWATYINYAILILCIIFFYGSGFFMVMIFNLFTILLIFIIRFNYFLYKSKKSLRHEK